MAQARIAPRSVLTDVEAGNRIQVSVGELCVGMYVGALDRPWLESPFLLQGFPIRTPTDIEQLRSLCRYVFVDKNKSAKGSLAGLTTPRTGPAVSTEVKQTKPRWKRKVSGLFGGLTSKRSRELAQGVEKSLGRSERVFTETRSLARRVIRDARIGGTIDTKTAREAVSDCVDHVLRNSDALMMFSNIKNKDNYTSEHSVNVSILSIVLGRSAGLQRAHLEEVGLAGLLHDVGKVLTPTEILNKPERLTDDEFLIMRMHPSQGRDILDTTEGLGRPIRDVAHQHHERLNGSGYPRSLRDNDLGLYTRIVAIADTYDAITSDRVYGRGRPSLEAFQILRAASGSHYDETLVAKFLDTIGAYPPGSAVQLRNGQFAIVVRRNPTHSLRPVVLLVKDAKQRPIKPRYIDTAEAKPAFHISKVVRALDHDIDVQMFQDRGFREALIG